MPSNSILSTTCCLLAIGAVTALTILPDEAATAPPAGQVNNVSLTETPAPLTAHVCQCDPSEVRDLEARIAALEARYRELENDIAIILEAKQVFPDPPQVQQQPAARQQAVYVQRPAASGNCAGGNCSTGGFRLFGRRR
jgi:hypothetical protein